MSRSLITAFALSLGALALAACTHNEDPAYCKSVKPGVVTTVNHYCVVVNDDPVDPSVKAINWKGQEVGLCCEGCRPDWTKMTEAEKDAAVARAIAKGKPQ